MKIEKISSNKIKLTFTDEDLKEFDVDFENLRYNSEDAQEIFWQLIEQADIENEFFDDGGQIIVEAVATKNDGLTMTVTRVEDSPKTPKIRRKKERHKAENNGLIIYSFDDFEKLVSGCKAIEMMFAGTSKLFKYDGKYCILLNCLQEETANVTEVGLTDAVLSEFGSKIYEGKIFVGKLEEYGQTILKENVVYTIAHNF